MITKKRLNELIEQGATIYVPIGKKNKIKPIDLTRCVVEDDGIRLTSVCLEKTFFYKLRDIFETREQAIWHKEFGNITRTERLELPTWEEFIKDAEFDFLDKQGYAWDFYSPDDETRISLVSGYYHFEYEYNKEDYILACRKCKELFLEMEVEDAKN